MIILNLNNMKDNTMSAQDYIARFGRIIIEDGVDLPDDTPGVDMSDYPQNGEVGNYVDVRSGDQTKLTVTKTKEGDVTVFTVTPTIDGSSSSVRIIPVTTLPVNPEEGVIYLKTKTNVSEDDEDQSNYREEYVWYKTSQNDTGHWEKVGDTSVNLENYVTFDDLEDSEPVGGGGGGTSKSVVIPRGKLRLYVNDTSNANFLGEFNPAVSSSIVIPIPEGTSDLNNDAGFITVNQVPRQVQADWDQNDTTAVDYIKNKPNVQPVPSNVSAFNNDAGYLTEHQSLAGYATTSQIPEVGNGVLTIRVNGTETTFSANQSNSVAVDIETGSSVQQVQSDWEEQNNSSPAYIRNKPIPAEPIEYSGEGGVIVNNTTHVISLEDGVISQPVEVEPEIPNNYYTYNGIKVIVPQGKGIIRLNHDYVLPAGANPSFYDAGVYIEDTEETANCPQTARQLDYLIVYLSDGVTITTEEAADWYYGKRAWKIPFNSQGCIYDPDNDNSHSWSYSPENTLEVYGDVLRDGDLCFDNYGNVCYISNLGSFYSYYDISPKQVKFTINKSKSVPVESEGASYALIQFDGSTSNIIPTSTTGNNALPNPTRYNKNSSYTHLNYTQYYSFRAAYKSPHTGKVFYVYGTPDESVALACYLREMDDGNRRPAFAGFLLFGTPNSLEPPIERNNSATEITSYQWTEPRPQIRFIEAASINNAVANIGTSSLQTDDIIVVKNPGTTLTFPSGNSTVTLYDIPFEPMFRWDGSEFKPMFYYIK